MSTDKKEIDHSVETKQNILFNSLKGKIKTISIDFDGSNGVGTFRPPVYEFHPKHASKTVGNTILKGYQIEDTNNSIYDADKGDWVYALKTPILQELLESLSHDILTSNAPGWETGNGSIGNITFDIDNNNVDFHHEWCVE